MNVTIWIRNGYPFSFDQYDSLGQALQVYSSNVTYNRTWIDDNDIHYVGIDNTNITTAKQVVTTLYVAHRYQAVLDRKYNGNRNNYCEHLEIVIQKSDENKPTWAEEARA
jgi:hypothetical protein